MNPQEKLCPFCHTPIADSYYFCPNCGKNLKPAPLPTKVLTQIGIYALSIFLPPLGLWPGIKYLNQGNEKAKIIGTVAISLTVISTVVTIWLAVGFINQANQSINGQLNQYQNLGL
ncbi:MAG: zinc ribbon domain-containing protein [Candidatus Microgenomates bacterium]|jgi:uncharacterized membrane protein YqaE (UPF0057 family)